MKLFLFIGLFVLSFNAFSSGTVDFLELEDNVVLFSTTENKQTSLACVASDKAQLWSLPLNTELGRAAYSLILTSMAKGDIALSIESAQDCGVLEGVERAQKITLVNNSATQSGGTKVAVYSGDDVRLGTFVYHANSQWHYLNEAGNKGNIASVVEGGGSGSLMFQGFDCQGAPYISDSSERSLYIIPGFNNDFFTALQA